MIEKNVCRHTVSRWKTPERSFLLRNHGKKTVQEIAEFVGKTPEQVRNRINYEKKLGVIK